MAAQPGQAREVVRGHRLLEPSHVELVRTARERLRGLLAQRAVGVDEQMDAVADRAARHLHTPRVFHIFGADLHLDGRAPIAPCPGGKLVCQLRVGIAGEPTRAVERDGIANLAEQRRQREIDDLGFQIPQRGVDGRDGHGDEAAPADVSDGTLHRVEDGRRGQRVAAFDGSRERVDDQGGGAGIGVCITKPRLAAALRVDHDQASSRPS